MFNLTPRERKIALWCITCTLIVVLSTTAFVMVKVFGQTLDLKRGAGATTVDIALGRIDTIKNVRKFGTIEGVSQVSFDCLWVRGGDCPFPTVGAPIIIAGGNINDTSNGDGARIITIEGCEAITWLEITEDIITNGVNDSAPTSQSWIRVNDVFVKESGVYGETNIGEVSIRLTSGLEMAVISPDIGSAKQMFFSVCEDERPGAKFITRVLTLSVEASNANKSARFRSKVRTGADLITSPFTSPIVIFEELLPVGAYTFISPSLTSVPARTDLWLEVMSVDQPVNATGRADGTRITK